VLWYIYFNKRVYSLKDEKGSFQSAIAPGRVPCNEIELCRDLPDSHRFFKETQYTGKHIIEIKIECYRVEGKQT